nr:YkgJ family cysteine cluster protein [Burkholderia multivorans]
MPRRFFCCLPESRVPAETAVRPASADVLPPHACREGCGACCIAPSISSPIPGMPDGKPAGVRCVQLGDDLRCRIFGRPERPACCSGLQPSAEMCGASRDEALAWLTQLEAATQPVGAPGGGVRR